MKKKIEYDYHLDNYNIIKFPVQEKEKTRKVKAILNIKQCGATNTCISSHGRDIYNCEYWERCNKLRDILKEFI